jgi:hypothetical protein
MPAICGRSGSNLLTALSLAADRDWKAVNQPVSRSIGLVALARCSEVRRSPSTRRCGAYSNAAPRRVAVGPGRDLVIHRE